MARNFHESYRHEDVPPPSERSTGFVFAGVATIIGAYFYDNLTVLAVWWAIAVALALVSWFRPQLLGPVSRLWFKFSLLLNRIVSPVVMLLMYVVAIIPFGLVMQLLRDPLRAKPRKELASYWIDKQAEEHQESSMTNQF